LKDYRLIASDTGLELAPLSVKWDADRKAAILTAPAQVDFRTSSVANLDGAFGIATGERWRVGNSTVKNDQWAATAQVLSMYSNTQSNSPGYRAARDIVTDTRAQKAVKAEAMFSGLLDFL
jgi:hypothetical protein